MGKEKKQIIASVVLDGGGKAGCFMAHGAQQRLYEDGQQVEEVS